jgi:hypothetical protein
MKVLIAAAVVFFSVVGIFAYEYHQHSSFASSYGVEAPWHMSQDERALLQPFITKQLQELGRRVSDTQSSKCTDAECMQRKLTDFQSARKSMDDAIDAASDFEFDISLPIPAASPQTS